MSTIAIVEDNPDNLLLLKVLLSDAYRLREYSNGDEAVAGILAAPPDLVLMDISLPGMNGNVALRHLRAQPNLRGLPVIALTANAMIGDREKYLSEGFDGYISKPIVDPEQLLSSIRELLAPTTNGSQLLNTQLAELRRAYLYNLAEKRDELQRQWSALQKKPQSRPAWEALKVIVHRLAGSAGSYGFEALGQAAQLLDAMIRETLRKDDLIPQDQVAQMSTAIAELDELLRDATH